MDEAHAKFEQLKHLLKKTGGVTVAFSGGVDSTFLLASAHQVLGDNVLAVTARSNLFPAREMNEAINFATDNHIRHIVCDVDEFSVDGFSSNPANRCYLCKKSLFDNFKKIAVENGFPILVEGSNTDDDNDYRPGLLAIKELQVLSPLKETGLTKSEIRQLSKEMGLPTWEKPSFACLASRFPYGETITREKLRAVELAEQVLFDLGFKQVRVRHHGSIARIEMLPDDITKIVSPGIRQAVFAGIKRAGFIYVTVDLQGYRTGSMNETIDQ